MKKFSLVITAFLAVIFVLNSCGDSDTTALAKYMTINGAKVRLAVAEISDYGVDEDITYREYRLSFKSSASNPANYLTFYIYSTSTTRLQEGTYTYQYAPIESGILSYTEVGSNLQYDGSGQAVSGKRISESNSAYSGTVSVSKKNDNYYFVFDLIADYDGSIYTIEGEYNDVLTSN